MHLHTYTVLEKKKKTIRRLNKCAEGRIVLRVRYGVPEPPLHVFAWRLCVVRAVRSVSNVRHTITEAFRLLPIRVITLHYR